MNRQAVFFLVVALIFGTLAVLLAQRWLRGQLPQVAAGGVDTVGVVVARRDIPIGIALARDQLDIVPWPRAYAPKGSFAQMEALGGRVVRRPVAAREPLLESTLHPEGTEAGLASVIERGKRAVSVKVDPVVGVAGFVRPGSRVDVLATVVRIDHSEDLPYTNSVLQDVRVLAIDQKLEAVANGEPKLVNVVTLEVEPQQAGRLTYISHEGRIQLSLRGPDDHEQAETRPVSVADVMPIPVPEKRPSRAGTAVQTIKGTALDTRVF